MSSGLTMLLESPLITLQLMLTVSSSILKRNPKQPISTLTISILMSWYQVSFFHLASHLQSISSLDMSWKAEANQRIDQLRKSDVVVNFVDTVASQLVLEVVQTSQSFPFGQAVNSEHIAQCRISNDDEVCDYVKNNFNWIVDTFRMKWNAIEPHRGDFKTVFPDQMIFWAQENNISVRGHSLLWHKSQPQWSLDLFGENFTEAMYEYLNRSLDHFDSLGIKMWDVINEMIDQGEDGHTMYIDQSGDPEIRVKIFKHVKERYPDTIFFINDYGIILDKHDRFNMYRQLIRDLLKSGAPIDAIGIQCHLNGNDVMFYLWLNRTGCPNKNKAVA